MYLVGFLCHLAALEVNGLCLLLQIFKMIILYYTCGTITNSNNYFDYSMFLPLPGNYYIVAWIDCDGDGDMFCGDLIGLYNYPNSFYMVPANDYTNININTNDYCM